MPEQQRHMPEQQPHLGAVAAPKQAACAGAATTAAVGSGANMTCQSSGAETIRTDARWTGWPDTAHCGSSHGVTETSTSSHALRECTNN
eukprot:7220194-Pyramimonas_sp.AAC.1